MFGSGFAFHVALTVVLVGVAATTVNCSPLLTRPPTLTTTLPVVAPAGTGTATLVADQVVGVACVPLKETLLASRVKPRSVPVIVTGVPTGPLVGAIAVRVGVGVGGGGGAVTVKGSPLLTRPPTITTTFPVVAPAGTATPMLVADHVDGVADVPLNVTMLASRVAPKLDSRDRD